MEKDRHSENDCMCCMTMHRNSNYKEAKQFNRLGNESYNKGIR